MNLCVRLIFCLFILAASKTVPAQEPIGAVVVLDKSASMLTSDPERLSVAAVQLLVSLLDRDDQVALRTFDQAVQSLGDFPKLDDEAKQTIKQIVAETVFDGAYTDLHGALQGALKAITAAQSDGPKRLDRESQPVVILLTDGVMDTGDKIQDKRLLEAVRDDLMPRYRSAGVKLFAIAFTAQSDSRWLNDIAARTGGFSTAAYAPEDLHKTFADIFEIIKTPEMLPVQEGRIQVDAAVDRLTMLMDRTLEAGPIRLQSPDGREYRQSDESKAVSWQKSAHFETISIGQPESGEWRLLGQAGETRAYVETDLRLDARLRRPSKGEDLLLEAWLEKEGGRLMQPQGFEPIRFSAELPAAGGQLILDLMDQGSEGDEKAGDGVHSAWLKPQGPGFYRVKVRAEGKTFQRIINLGWQVPPLESFKEGALRKPSESTQALSPKTENSSTGLEDSPVEKASRESTVENSPGAQRIDEAFIRLLFLNLIAIAILGTGYGLWKMRRHRRLSADRAKELSP